MWHSEADIYKDLMSLDDSGKDETYKILYSRGRGFKNHRKPEPTSSFVDSRTGETINLDEILEPSDACHRTRGRGNALSRFLRSGNQLEKQLRLARPLGSGDNVIEAFCRRNIPVKSEESTSESEYDAGQPGTSTNTNFSPFGVLIDNMKKKVKATRNSKLQQNALINSLISKGTCESDQSSAAMKPNLGNADAFDINNDDEDDDNGNGKGESSITSLSRSFDFDCSSIKSTESNIQTSGSKINVKIDNVKTQERDEEDTRVDDCSKTLEKCEIRKLSPRISANFYSPNIKTSTVDKKYQSLGKRFNKEDADEHWCGLQSENFTISNADFPPLRKTIKDTLENDGTLGKFKAEMRTKIMDILNSQLTTEKPKLSNETLLINELIREYLTWNGYKYAKSVFIQECGLSSEPLTRNQLLEDLGVCDTEDSSKFSVLHGMITAFKEYVKKGT